MRGVSEGITKEIREEEKEKILRRKGIQRVSGVKKGRKEKERNGRKGRRKEEECERRK